MPLIRYTLLGALAASLATAACGASDGARARGTTSTAATHAPAARDSTPRDTALLRRADHARIEGSASAPLWVVEVSDFQCPYCRQWHEETYPAVKREYVDAGKIRLAYINFPIPGHRNAWPAAEAAMCAAAQDKFWPMHDGLFATQRQWEGMPDPSPVFDSLATAAGVQAAPYHQCLSSHATRPLIQADVDRATESGVNSTPSFIIGDKMIRGAEPVDVFRRAIDEALRSAK
ncbi:MAG TPA: thioredoxin domain-containing protein [Gemmatimonadaceae bacterium]